MVWTMAGVNMGRYLAGFLVMGTIIGAWAQVAAALTSVACGDTFEISQVWSR